MYRALAAHGNGFAVTAMPLRFGPRVVRLDSKHVQTSSRRTIFGMSRLPLKLERKRQLGKVESIQKVGFRKPRFRLKNVAMSVAATFIAFHVYYRIVLEPFERGISDIVKDMPMEDLEEDHKPLFIPFPGTTQQLKPAPYRGSDPEWQEFVRFSKDQKLAQDVRNELATLVVSVANKNSVLTLKAGKGMKLRRYWLDVDFPYSPPPEFERSGIEIGDDYIAWATQPVDSLTVFKLRRALWPSALTISMWSFTKILVADETNRLMNFLGLRSPPEPPPLDQILARHQQMIRGTKNPSKDGPPAEVAAQATKHPATVKPSQAVVGGRPADSAGKGTQDEDENYRLTQQLFGAINAHFFRPMVAFKTKLSETWRPVQDYPPRGSILVSGFIEVDAPRAWIVIDVKAAWDPQTKSFDPRSMHIALRRMQAKKQGPMGGP